MSPTDSETTRRIVYSGEPMMLRAFLKGRLHLSTRSLKRLKYREDGLRVNGETVTVRRVLRDGDVVELDLREEEEQEGAVTPVDLPLEIIWQDSCVTVCDKPPHMPTHPVHDHILDTAANALAYDYFRRTGRSDYVFRTAYRLDANTSGLIVAANDFVSSGSFFRQVSSRTVEKTYLAITKDVPPHKGQEYTVIDRPIARRDDRNAMRTVDEGGVRAVTAYRVLAVSDARDMALLAVRTLTGRTHQIRVHMAYAGCPLLGDFLYGEETPLISRHALHACRVAFDHPADGRRMVFVSPIPGDMTRVLRDHFADYSNNTEF